MDCKMVLGQSEFMRKWCEKTGDEEGAKLWAEYREFTRLLSEELENERKRADKAEKKLALATRCLDDIKKARSGWGYKVIDCVLDYWEKEKGK